VIYHTTKVKEILWGNIGAIMSCAGTCCL